MYKSNLLYHGDSGSLADRFRCLRSDNLSDRRAGNVADRNEVAPEGSPTSPIAAVEKVHFMG